MSGKSRFGGSLGNIGADPKNREDLEAAAAQIEAQQGEPEDEQIEAMGGYVPAGLLKDEEEAEKEDIGTARTQVAVSSVPPPPQPFIPPAPQVPREEKITLDAPIAPVAPAWEAERLDTGSLPPVPPAEPSVWLEPDNETRAARDAEALEYEREEQRVLQMPVVTPSKLWISQNWKTAVIVGMLLGIVALVGIPLTLMWLNVEPTEVSHAVEHVEILVPNPAPPVVIPAPEPIVVPPAEPPPVMEPVVRPDVSALTPVTRTGNRTCYQASEAEPTACQTAGARLTGPADTLYLCRRGQSRGDDLCGCLACPP